MRALLRLDRYFQLGGLEHFNAKFEPSWQPRNLLFPTPAGFPRVLLAAMWAEGVLGKPALPHGLRGSSGRAARVPQLR